MSQNSSLKRKLPLIVIHRSLFRSAAQMETSIVLLFYIRPSPTAAVLRSVALKEYFSKLTSNVEVLYPTHVHNGLLLCKSKRSKFWRERESRERKTFLSTSGRENRQDASRPARWLQHSSEFAAASPVPISEMSDRWTDDADRQCQPIVPAVFAVSPCFRLLLFVFVTDSQTSDFQEANSKSMPTVQCCSKVTFTFSTASTRFCRTKSRRVARRRTARHRSSSSCEVDTCSCE